MGSRAVQAGAEAGAMMVVLASPGMDGEDEGLPGVGEGFEDVIGSPSREGVRLACRAVLLVFLTPADTDLGLR